MLEIKKNRVLLNAFSDINDYTTFLNQPIREGRSVCSETGDKHFTGTESYEEALDLLKYGDEKNFEYIKKRQKELKIDKLLGNVINKNKTFNDLIGYQANVPLFLNGVPTNMINEEKIKRDFKIINIYLNLCASCGISTNEIRNVGTIYASVIDILEKMGYRINLYVGNATEEEGEILINCTRVKTDREPLNLKKLAFTMINPSFLRRIGFRYMEVCDSSIDFTHRAYGCPYTNEERIVKILNERLKADFISFSYQNGSTFSIKDVLKRLEEKGLKLNIDSERQEK